MLLTAVADSEGDFLKHNLPLSSYTKQQKKTVQAPGNYPLIYTERISINICILKIRVLMSKSLKYMGGILVLSESSQNHVVNCEEMRLAKYWV